jgi:hypothetical protein
MNVKSVRDVPNLFPAKIWTRVLFKNWTYKVVRYNPDVQPVKNNKFYVNTGNRNSQFFNTDSTVHYWYTGLNIKMFKSLISINSKLGHIILVSVVH